MFVEKIILKIVGALAVMALCFTLGYAVATSNQKDKQIEVATLTQADSNQEVLASQAKSIAIEDKVAASTQKIEAIKDEVVRRVEANEPKVITKTVTVYKCPGDVNDSSTNGNDRTTVVGLSETYSPWTFDGRTVRLLNAARANDTDSATSVSNASDQTPSDVTVGKLVENDLEVVGLYHEQSERFKALQDYVKDKQDRGYMFCKKE
ncbi:hypothetical protein ACNAUY_08245 [Acinetobacter tibetensis]|uniref:hypothetical protein n=1 Tax=Acinetobacter tibetensis TaxID=2943497 RepID=UPI003A4E44A1